MATIPARAQSDQTASSANLKGRQTYHMGADLATSNGVHLDHIDGLKVVMGVLCVGMKGNLG